MSRIISGKMRLDIQSVDPGSFIEAAIETVRPSADAKGIRLSTLLDPGAGPVNGDPNRLQQVIWNLLSNAIKFTDRNGRVQVVLERVNSHIEIAVADTGIGIKPEFLAHVFDRFRQDGPPGPGPPPGSGWGCRSSSTWSSCTAARCASSARARAQGATFTVCLPLTVVQRTGEPGHHVHPRGPSRTSPLFRPLEPRRDQGAGGGRSGGCPRHDQARAGGLRGRGADAGSAAEALQAVEESRPDVLVSDIGMPDVDGYELLRRIRALGPEPGRPSARHRPHRLRALRGSDPRAAGRLPGPRREAGRALRARGHRRQRGRPRRRAARRVVRARSVSGATSEDARVAARPRTV